MLILFAAMAVVPGYRPRVDFTAPVLRGGLQQVFPQQIAPIGVRPLGRLGNAKRHIVQRQISMPHLLSADAEGVAISEINRPHFKNRGIFNIC